MDSKLFPNLPEKLDTLTGEQLAAAIEERREIVRRIDAEDQEIVPADQFSAEAILSELAAGADQIETLLSEQTLRGAAEEEYVARKAALVTKAGATLSTESEDADGDEEDEPEAPAESADVVVETDTEVQVETPAETAAAVTEPDPVAASAAAPAIRRRLPAPTAAQEPVIIEESNGRSGALVASADVNGFQAGEVLDRPGLAKALAKTWDQGSAKPGYVTKAVVASAHWEAPEERQLGGNWEQNFEKIRAVMPESMDAAALVASGGLCAPLTPIYDLPQISTEARPLRDNLPAFQAARGGITWATPPSIADVTTAVGIVTAEEDGEGGTFATKTCQTLDCDPFNEAEIAAIYHCLEWGNIGSRAWPERVAQFTDTVMAAWARLAETNILNLMKAGSTQVTAAQATYGYGALSSLTSQILVAAAGYRSRFRMSVDSRFRVVFPLWVRDLLLSDLINSQFDRFELNYAGVEAFLRERNIDAVWTLDGETAGAQVFGAQNAGALLTFPPTVKWFLFPEGTWIFLDSGTLELGIVRDSTLNATNDFQVFGESFETVAQVGFQSLEITSTLCPTGTTAGPATAITCS